MRTYNEHTTMNKIRYSSIAAKITGWAFAVLIIAVVALFIIGYITRLSIFGDSRIIVLILPAWFFASFLSLRLTIGKNSHNFGIAILKDNKTIEPRGAQLLGLTWGFMWRVALLNVPFAAVGRILTAGNEPVSGLNLILSIAIVFFAALWLLKHQMGSTTIVPIEEIHDMNVLGTTESEIQIAAQSTASILFSVAILSYFAIGLVQIGAIFTFFRDYLGWWWIASILAATFVAYMPVVGAIAGTFSAIEVWEWKWYWAVALFFYPILLLIGGGGLSMIYSIFSKKS
jgi:hypothetical protein